MFQCLRGVTLLCPSGTANDNDRKHLFVLLTDPFGPAHLVLMAPLCSVKKNIHHDETCLIATGEHPFVRHQSYVAYDKCRVLHASDVEGLIKNGYFVEKDSTSPALFKKIVTGLEASKFTKPFAREFLQDFERSLTRAGAVR